VRLLLAAALSRKKTKLQFRTASIRDMCSCDECTQKRSQAAINDRSTNDRSTNDRSAPDSYAEGVKQLRVAESTPESQFAERWAADRTREMEATRAALDAAASVPRLKTLTTAELEPYSAPSGYDIALRARKLEGR
jgi:hypothetical protein